MTSSIYNIDQLRQATQQGLQAKYIFFWGHQSKNNQIDKACFSQWFPAHFTINNVMYPTAEHYMMAEKARLFNDIETLAKILNARTPAQAKALGREVKGYDDQLWIESRFDIVVNANLAKFEQNIDLKSFLINISNRILVEASPVDKIWGIGLAQDHPDTHQPEHWQGLNLLGFALMKVRDQLAEFYCLKVEI
jgi:ribA/ribD-fused uncharacterized protein